MIKGYIDALSTTRANGWACDTDDFGRKLQIRVFYKEREIANGTACLPRGDLKKIHESHDFAFSLEFAEIEDLSSLAIVADGDYKLPFSAKVSIERYQPVVLGLNRGENNVDGKSSEELNNKAGGNTGNFAFHYAIDQLLGGELPVYPWSSHVEEKIGRIGIMPLANQLGAHCDMGGLGKWVAAIKMPVLGIGLGAQSRECDGGGKYMFPQIPPGTRRWLEIMAEHAPASAPNISLRGEFTRRFMEKLGLEKHTATLGCPSLFINLDPQLGKRIAAKIKEPGRVCLAAGHYQWKHFDALENSLAHIITESDGAFVVASPLEMIRIGRGEIEALPKNHFNRAREHFYARLCDQDFIAWTKKRGKVFFDVPGWMDFYRQFDFVIGPRIHGVMLALQAGIPALCIAIDSRTLELCEIMKVPYVMAKDVQNGMGKKDLLRYFKFDPDEFDANRRMLAKKFCEFLEGNKLKGAPELYEFISNVDQNSN